jgi:oxygen-dependent protoporphyrinogen oxidase
MAPRTAGPRVAVVGAGITGLATAHRLVQSMGEGADVVVFEADERPGGKIRTIEVGGLRVEAGADSFVVRKPWAVDLCTEIGLGEELVVPGATGAYVWTDGRLTSFPPRSAFGIPSRVTDLVRWGGMPLGARLRAALDIYRPARRGDEDEALGRLLRRRLGKRAARIMVEPLLAGLHAGDPLRLSTRATFPELADWELLRGSLIRGARAAIKASAGSGGGPMFATVWGGLDRLIDVLVSHLGPQRLRLGTRVLAIGSEGGRYRLRTDAGELDADAVVLASPAFEAGQILSAVNPGAGAALTAIPYASTAVVILVYPEGTADRLPDGTGFVTPIGPATITACTWISRKWPSEELGTRAVIRCFVGRAGSEEALDLPDDRLIEAARAEAEAAAPMQAPPEATAVLRWPRAMPQYEVGHLDRVEEIDRALSATPGIFVAGSAYRGVGIPDCIRQAGEAAERVGEYLRTSGVSERPISGLQGNEREANAWTI